MGGADDFDPFQMFFGGGGQQRQAQKQKCKQRLIQMKITLEEAYNGGNKVFEYARRIVCIKCSGTGSANPAANHKCAGCAGRGVKVVLQRMGGMVLQSQQPCTDCKGEGNVIKDKCTQCKGEKVAYTTKSIKIELDKGVPDGFRYSFYGEGDEYPEVETGDLFVEIFQETHKDFIRKGADLIYKTEITLLQALTGFSFIINFLDGRKVLVKTNENEIIKPKVNKSVKEYGMPFHNSPFRFGNLIIEFDIMFPDKLEKQEIAKISEILKNEKLNKVSDKPEDAENHYATDYKIEEENTHHAGGQGGNHEEDDEENGGRSHKVNCANQ